MTGARQESNKTSSEMDRQSPLTRLYAVAYLQWEREEHKSFEVGRAELLDMLAGLQRQMAENADSPDAAKQSVLLGGQTVILGDIASVRPDLLTLLVIYNAGGRLGIGPWYIIVDDLLVSSESLIRNLLTARADAANLGLKLMPVVYASSSSGHTAQLPQILRGFGIDAAFLRYSAIYMPFRWEALDGSSILVVNHELRPNLPVVFEDTADIVANIRVQQSVRSDGPFVWLFDASNSAQMVDSRLSEIKSQVGIPVVRGDLSDYVQALREELPDVLRPSLKGELPVQALRENVYLSPGTLSARIYLKQANADLQSYLVSVVEPWLAVALTHGTIQYPENLRALLDHGWRLLLKNQARNALGGGGNDAVHRGNELQFQQAKAAAQEVVLRAFDGLSGMYCTSLEQVNQKETTILVWNPHNWPVRQVVELHLLLPEGLFPVKLTAPDGKERLFSWKQVDSESDSGGLISFLAEAPSVGYAVYTVQLGDGVSDRSYRPVVTSGDVITNTSGETLSVQDGELIWRFGDGSIKDVFQFFDGGDAGDIYNYSPPKNDIIVKADLVQGTKVESSPVYQRLILRYRMRVAPALSTDRIRGRGVKLIELTTTATFYENIPGVFFRITFSNLVKDHRLRVHLRTNIRSSSVWTDSGYSLIERPAKLDGPSFPPDGATNMEGVSNTQPLQMMVVAKDSKQCVGVLVRGLPEYEVLQDDNKRVTFALTLVRSVGWLGRDDLRTRVGAVAPMIVVPDAQCQRDIVAEFALISARPDDDFPLLQTGREFNSPLQAYQYNEPPETMTQSYLSLTDKQGETGKVILSALKPPEKGDGWIVRLSNPQDTPAAVYLSSCYRLSSVYQVTLAEQVDDALPLDIGAGGKVMVQLKPHEIVTLHLIFKQN